MAAAQITVKIAQISKDFNIKTKDVLDAYKDLGHKPASECYVGSAESRITGILKDLLGRTEINRISVCDLKSLKSRLNSVCKAV